MLFPVPLLLQLEEDAALLKVGQRKMRVFLYSFLQTLHYNIK